MGEYKTPRRLHQREERIRQLGSGSRNCRAVFIGYTEKGVERYGRPDRQTVEDYFHDRIYSVFRGMHIPK